MSDTAATPSTPAPAAQTVMKAPDEVKVAEAPVAKQVSGKYTLEAGDTPGRVSTKLFGRGHRAGDIVRANPDAGWVPGEQIDVPR